MKFTFGIITSQNVNTKVLNSIYEQSIPKFEIIEFKKNHLVVQEKKMLNL